MSNMIGFLDTKGILHSCKTFGHLSKAEEIVNDFNLRKESPYELCEDTLLKNGWICIRIGDIYKGTYDSQGNILFITPEQQNYFAKHILDFNEHQRADVERLLKDFGELYKYRNQMKGGT